MDAHSTTNRKVAGSNPASQTIRFVIPYETAKIGLKDSVIIQNRYRMTLQEIAKINPTAFVRLPWPNIPNEYRSGFMYCDNFTPLELFSDQWQMLNNDGEWVSDSDRDVADAAGR